LKLIESSSEPLEVFDSVEAEERDIEEEKGDSIEGEVAGIGEVFESSAQHGKSILGPVEEYGSRGRDRESPEGLVSAGHGDGNLSGELSFTDLGVSAEDADAALEPKGFDEPSILRGNRKDLADVLGVKGENARVHRNRGWHGRPPGRWGHRYYERGRD
jgi:hypothetical protein